MKRPVRFCVPSKPSPAFRAGGARRNTWSSGAGSTMRISRLHSFELEDQTWFPSVVRDLATDSLHFVETIFALHRPVVVLLAEALRADCPYCTQTGKGDAVVWYRHIRTGMDRWVR